MRYFSLFSRIGGFELAMPKNWQCVGYSEIDKHAIQIYQKHFPTHKNFGDITKIDIDNLPDFDLLVGGSPCQDLSIAKNDRKGLKGEKSKLFFKYLEILQRKKPKYFLLENVASMPNESKEAISNLLGVFPVMINAALVSAQSRKRLFWANFPIEQPKDREIFLRDILEEKVDDYYLVKEKSNTIRAGGIGSGINDKHNWDTIRIGQIGKGGQSDRVYSPNGKSVSLSANGGGMGAKTGLYNIKGCASRTYPRNPNGEKRQKQIEIRKDEKANSITTIQTDSMISDNSLIRRLTPIECERLQCFPDNWTAGISNTQRYKTLGNAVNVEVVKHIIKFLYEHKIK